MKEYNADLTFKKKFDYECNIKDEEIGKADLYGRSMWMASLHPRIAGIRKANTEDGEQPNVQIAFREGHVGVRTIKAIAKDETLLY